LGNGVIDLQVVNAGDPSTATFFFNGAPAGVAFPNGIDNGGVGYTVAEINDILNPGNTSLSFEENGSSFTAGDRVSVSLFTNGATFNRRVAESLQKVGQVASHNYQQHDIYNTRLSQSETLLESVSGVSIDEELLDLNRYEKQFAANGKVIQAVNELMDSVLALVQ
jgi:flagellar hook-associated protein 1 FlgK